MSFTKLQFADLAISLKSGGAVSTASKFDRREVYKFIDIGLGSLLGSQYLNMWLQGEKNLNGDWITPFPYIPVKKDEARDDFYSDIPVQLISLTDERGMVSIQKMKGDADEFVPLKNGQWETIKNLETGFIKNKIFYYIENNKIRYKNLYDGDKCGPLLFKMVCGAGSLEEDQFLPVAGELEYQLVQIVLGLMDVEGGSQQKKINDGNANNQQ